MAFTFAAVKELVKREANFYRIHLLFFTLVPLILSGIFYAANGQYHIAYIDCVFLCYSAATVTGLSTINLSTCTGFQQALLFIQMILGNVTTVSWIMVLIRKQYFREHCELVVRDYRERHRIRGVWGSIAKRSFRQNTRLEEEPACPDKPIASPGGGIIAALAAGAGVGLGVSVGNGAIQDAASEGHITTNPLEEESLPVGKMEGIATDAHSFTSSPRSIARPVLPSPGHGSPGVRWDERSLQGRTDRNYMRKRPTRQFTMMVPSPTVSEPPRRKDQDMGGFPGPIELFQQFVRTGAFGPIERAWNRIAAYGRKQRQNRYLSWLPSSIDGLIVGRNSEFYTDQLTDEQLERLGGIEYRALRFLSYFIFAYFVAFNLIPFIIITPWLQTRSTYDGVFTGQPRLVPKAWFTAFQVVGAYTGGGMSLVDAGMVPFQKAYVMIFAMIFAILAGNHGLPIFLRFLIWIFTKVVPEDSHADQALHFLLDHPRRCFIYLFPSHVTWFLLATLVLFTGVEWTSFKVLNIGLPALNALSTGDQAVVGLFQSFAVRASGFPIISIASLAPSFQFLCIIMMYIAVFPVAMSIQSTNVYEERSLGVFEAAPDDVDEEPAMGEGGSRGERVSRYFHWHLRRQAASDIWWLVWGIFFVCIIERGKIMDDVNAPWFNLFRIIFEMVSAFGGIGLTLGVPTDNFSFSGALKPLSKLIVCIIMLRGRHRGLPVAIDRAILLPSELIPVKPTEVGATQTPTGAQNVEVSDPKEKAIAQTSVV